MSRGSREGNNAFTKDQAAGTLEDKSPGLVADVINWNLTPNKIADLNLVLAKGSVCNNHLGQNDLVGHIVEMVRSGRREMAAYYMEKDQARGGQAQFSKFHLDSLSGKGDPWKASAREANAKKKADWTNKQLTPLHCACINPNPGPLEALFKVCLELHLTDSGGWKLVHYASVCAGILPLQFLVGRGASLDEPNKEGLSPLLLACKAGKIEVVKYIIRVQALADDPSDLVRRKLYGVAQLDKAGKDSWTALHLAVSEGRQDVVALLLESGARPDKQLNTTYDKMSALMLASANGDLEMVKLLVETGHAKVELGDRYKRSALTHACINGASSVAAFLLRIGANPDRADSSGNTCLHYACAYGWWFCMQALLQAGACLQPRNEWGLSPLGVAVMKGHKGIADHLATLPGIDINMKDDKGRTLLASMLVEQQGGGFSMNFLNEIKVLVERHGADPQLADFGGRSSLHHLAASACGPGLKAWVQQKEDKDHRKELDAMLAIATYLNKTGVSTWLADNNGDFPITIALTTKSTWRYGHRMANMELVKLLLDMMLTDLPTLEATSAVEGQFEKGIAAVVRSFAVNLSLPGAVESLEVFNQLVTLVKRLVSQGALAGFHFLDKLEEDQTRGLTIFASCCNAYCSSPLSKKYQGEPSELGVKVPGEASSKWAEEEARCWEAGCRIISTWVSEWSPTLHLDMPPRKKDAPRRLFLPLLSMARLKKDNHRAFRVLLTLVPEVDALDVAGSTPLLEMIDQNQVELARLLLDQGARVNRVRTEEVRLGKGEVRKVVEVPLQRAVRTGSLAMAELLLQKGASINTLQATGASTLLMAVERAAKDRTKQSLQRVSLLLDHGSNVNECGEKGRTGLHVAVNASRGDSDSGVDLESLLLHRGANVCALDCRGRTALHYAFVKIGNHKDRSACDPIQVVSSLVEGMTTASLDHTDKFGNTALHYAGLRGATVSALLLLQKGSQSLEAKDSLGNTPLSLAVLGKHDACSMMLLQRGACIEVTIKEEEDTEKEQPRGLWRHLAQHWRKDIKPRTLSLFEGLVANDWLGLTYLVLAKMEQSGMTLALALEVAFRLQRLQFAKTMLSRFTQAARLKEVVSEDRTLLGCLAFHSSECKDLRAKELMADVFELLIQHGVDPGQVDKHGCLPLHYACLHRNTKLIQLLLEHMKMTSKADWLEARDSQGRTPLAAYFWNYKMLASERDETLQLLLSSGASVNSLAPCKHLSVLDCGFAPRFLDRHFLEPALPDQVSTSPLMIAITHGDVAMVRQLLENNASLTLVDSRGWTPAMYAVKAVRMEVIEELLPKLKLSSVEETDSIGLLHHAVALDPLSLHTDGATTHDNTAVVKAILGLCKPTPSTVSSLVQLAGRVNASRVGNELVKQFGGKYSEEPLRPPTVETVVPEGSFNHKNDALGMMTALEREVEEKQTKEEDKPNKTQTGCTVTDGHIHGDYNILLSKIDVGLGSWGLYNFYRLQIWKDAHKDLYVLFTNWGRIERYGHGQFQNTPYSAPEEAIAEFCKIFAAKTGNKWDEKERFVAKPRKYRIVEMELATKVIRPPVNIDLKSTKTSSLPKLVVKLLEEAASPAMLEKAYTSAGDIDTGAVPFSRIKREVVEKARGMLTEIGPLVEEKEKLDSKKYEVEGEKQAEVLAKLDKVLVKICQLSSEYYHLVPKPGFEFERVTPIDSSCSLEEEKHRLNLLLEFETAKALLLGAMLRRKEVRCILSRHLLDI